MAEKAVDGSWWKVKRNALHGARQLAHRQEWPDMPFIHGEILDRMLERSEIMRPGSGAVVDFSLGRLDAARRLASRFSDRQVHLIRWRQDVPQVQASGWLGRQLQRLRGAQPEVPAVSTYVVADERSPIDALPPAGLVWSNGLLHRIADPAALLRQWHGLLAPGGALFFSCLGPDTAPELADAAKQHGLPYADFADMHDWGDLLVRAGFSDPVMEMERLVLTYRSAEMLLRDWRALGGNPAAAGTGGLRGRSFLQSVHKVLQNRSVGSLQISLEILYGHAWRVERPTRPAEVSIPLSQIRRKP